MTLMYMEALFILALRTVICFLQASQLYYQDISISSWESARL